MNNTFSRLTSLEHEAFNTIMNFIKDYDGCELKTYSESIEHNSSVNGEQYYNPNRIDMYCVKLNYRGNPIHICLKTNCYERMEVNIYPANNNGSHVINFIYHNNTDNTYFWFADFHLLLYDTEEEYFQASTVDDLIISTEENKMFMNFYNEFMELLKYRSNGKL